MAVARGKERILEVAEDLFVEKGFTGTSMSEIAEKAGVAKSLIYHHFESKQALWHALVHEHHERSGVIEKFYDTISASGPEALEQLVTGRNGFFQFLKSHPRMVRLFSWLNLEEEFDIDYPGEEIRKKVMQRIAELQRNGWLRPEIDPGLIPIVFLSLMMHWFSARRYLVPWLGEGPDPERTDDRYISGVMDILMNGIARESKF